MLPLGAVLAFLLAATAPASYAVVIVSISSSQAEVMEDSGVAVTFYVTADFDGYSGTANYTVSGTAVGGTDYTPALAATGTLAFSGQSTAITTVVPIDNVLLDGSRTVQITINSITGANLSLSATRSAVVTIRDDEMPLVSISAIDASASETGADTGTFAITSPKPVLTAPVTVDLAVTGGAALGADYTLSAGASQGAILQTSSSDFNAGNTTANTAVEQNSVLLAATGTPGAGPAELTGTETGLKGLWHMNGDWLDASGNANDGTAGYGATFSAAAKLGSNAGSWDGINDYVVMADTAATRFGTASLSIELWMNPSAFTSTDWSGGVRWFSKSNFCAAWETSAGCNWLVAQILADGRVNFGGRGYGDSATFGVTASPGSELPLNQWSHVAIVIDRDVSPAHGYIYVNGNRVGDAELPNLTGDLDMVRGSFQIGSTWAEYKGLMDEVAVFGRALTAADVLANYDGSTRAYAASGTFSSSVMDAGVAAAAATLNHTMFNATNTAISVDVRAGNTATPDGSWTAWQTAVADGGSIAGLGTNRYYQYRANLSTTDAGVTPRLHDVKVSYSLLEAPSLIAGTPGVPKELAWQEAALKGLWHMNGDWLDASGNGNNGGALNGTTFSTAAKLGSHAGSWDGVNDWLSIEDSTTTRYGMNSLTIELWMKPSAFTSADWADGVRWFSKSLFCSNWTTNPRCEWLVANILADGRVSFGGRGGGDSGTFSVTASAGNELTLNQWSHVALVIDRDVSPARGYIYINGVKAAEDALPNLTGNLNMRLARTEIGATFAEYSGQMDELAIFGRALTAAEVQSHYDGSWLMQAVLPVGSTSSTITLTPVDDTIDEYDEAASLTLMSGPGYYPGSASTLSASVIIADNDVNEVNVAAAADGAEQGGTSGSFTVSRTGILDAPLTVNYTVGGTATAGTDYTALSGTVTIPAGSGVGTNSATVSFTPINDALIEGAESISLILSANAAYVIGAAGNATANIVDNDSDGSSRADTSGIFTQDNWAATVPTDGVGCTSFGGTWTGSACIGNHTTNRNGWSIFSSAGNVVDAVSTPGQVSAVANAQQWLQTDESASGRGFRVGGHTTAGFATVSGFGDAANVTLAPIAVGNGADGAFDSSSYIGGIAGIGGVAPSFTINTNEASHLGVYNFTDFRLAAGHTITVTGSKPLTLYVKLDAKIDGTINAGGIGRSPGPAGGAGGLGGSNGTGVGPVGEGGGSAPDPDAAAASCRGCVGGGGGGHSTVGSDGTTGNALYLPGLGGETYGDDVASTLFGGSGGGGNYSVGNCPFTPYGGGGGGAVLIQAGASISVAGQINANGAAGSNYTSRSASGSCFWSTSDPGGGGSGGTIKLLSTTIVLVDGGTRLSAVGGSGGSVGAIKRGGDGAGGRIRVEAANLQGIANANAGTGTLTTAPLSTAFIAAGSGTYTSAVAYMGNVGGKVAAPGVWTTLNWSETVPAGSSLGLSVHSCALPDCSDRGAGDWSAPANGQDISTLTFVDDSHAYIQYKVDMTTTGGVLPRLQDLTVSAISYGGEVWLQTDNSTLESGFNKAGASTSNAIVAGSNQAASVILGGLAAGTGADGTFDSMLYDGSSIPGISGMSPNITIDTSESSHGGVYNFASFTVRMNDTVRVKGGNPFVLMSLGDVTVDGVLNAKGYSGDAGGANGLAGPAASNGGAGCVNGGGAGAGLGAAAGTMSGGGGGGHASAGADGEMSYTVDGAAGGPSYGDASLLVLEGGSGGGGAAVPSGTCANAAIGGGGGGAVEITTGGLLKVGTVGLISVDGGAGGDKAYNNNYAGGGAGGGSGGSLKVAADRIVLNNPGASLSARGGQGGASYFFADGGAGGDGRIHLAANEVQGIATVIIGSGTLVNEALVASPLVSGSYTSAIYDAGFPVSWDPAYWVAATPTGTTLAVSMHSCALADCSDRGPGDWSAATDAQDISSLAFVDDGHQYLQYRVDMTSQGLVPRLDSIAINLRQDQDGAALVSSVYDSQDNGNQIVALLWTADTSGPGTGVKFQLRTSADGVTWGPWYGPTGTGDYYTVSGSAINPVHADGSGDRYVQYKASLVIGNPEYTPVLQDVTLKYITFGSGAVVGSGGSFGANSPLVTGGSGGGGVLGTVFLALLLLGMALKARSFRLATGMAGRTRLVSAYLKGVGFLALTAMASSASAEFVLNFSEANPVPSGAYKSFSVGNINSDFYQEFIIQKGFGYWQGDSGTASGGGAANITDPLGFGGAPLSGTGNATGNPNRVIIWQRNKSADMLLDFLKDKFDKKPRIIQTVVTNDILSEFSVDMRGISYSNGATVAPLINTLSVGGQTSSPGQAIKWDMARDAANSHVTAGMYTYTTGAGPGGSIGTYSYGEGNYPVNSINWSSYFDKTDASNVWTNSTYKPK